MADLTALPAHGEFSKVRGDLETFTCDRCRKDKTSKNRYVAHAGTDASVALCNGCYGEIVSKAT